MSGLRPPPKRDTSSRAIGRFLVLLVLLVVVGVIIFGAVTIQQIPLVEDVALADVEGLDVEVVDGIQYNVAERGIGDTTIVLIHDADIAGSATLDPLAAAVGEDTHTMAIDLPGFGLSSRMPESGVVHTVGAMAEGLITVIEARSDGPVVLVGVGLGGKVAAEIAVLKPDLVAGLAMVDVDFYSDGGLVRSLERIPWLGLAVTYTYETSGSMSKSGAPYCDQGGWCPGPAETRAREFAATVVDTTQSLFAFRNTEPASNVPSLLSDVTAPTLIIWSNKGPISESSKDRLGEVITTASVESLDVFQAHLEDPESVAASIRALLP